MLSFRQGLFTLGSLCVSTAVVGNAYLQKRQFYPSVVFLTKSNPCMAVIYVQAAVIVWLMAKAMGKLFFGQLRPAEIEHLLERSWYAITETCLAFTVFRDDFSPKFIALFVLLLVLKGFHWLAEDRVDFMERSPNISLLFHIRVLSLLALLSVLDYAFVRHAYFSVATAGASVQVVFGFEYAILLSSVWYILIKYVLHSIDSRAETQWENKAVLLLYTELMMSSSKVLLYATFMLVMLRIHTFPLFAIRPMYLSIRALKRAFKDVVLSRQAINNMNTLYPDATAEELASADNVCIICREEMQVAGAGGGVGANKKLPCNHIFHAACLRSWFQRQQTCPTCRSDVLNISGRGTLTPGANHGGGAAAAGAVAAGQRGGANLPPGAQIIPPFQMPNMQALFANWPNLHHPPNANNIPAAQQPQPANNNNNDNNNARPAGPGAPSSSGLNNAGTNQTGGQGANGASGGAAGAATPTASTIIPPPPPFTLLPALFLPPPPPIIPGGLNLGTLSEGELRAMEGNERLAVEARIQHLRNIQILLDAAVTMMAQYNNATTVASAIPQPATTAAQQASASGTQPASATNANAVPKQQQSAQAGSPAGPTNATQSTKSSTSTSNTMTRFPHVDTSPTRMPDAASPSSCSAASASTIDAIELRRRRVEKLAGPITAAVTTATAAASSNGSAINSDPGSVGLSQGGSS
ncbi:E3 ubiquitin-protein ligase synoviolin B-like isoform X2 [Varroa destructor]|uniref:RING-type E3 ubiquitin transferase n=1 Tax=Varroa destructor TaxID=109461 RepID=A0A7M7KSC5_VARDE|nr:E3 ubiquitin-protein ligase synoviolin B-like isoform X2 [Varroa destructor]